MDKNQNDYFEEFKNQKINSEDVKKAEGLAGKLGSLANDFLLLISMLKDYWNGDFEISKIDLAIITGAIIYVVSPIDAVPDIIPMLGFTDDASVVGIVLYRLSSLIEEYKRTRR